jgi:hypothetical protein
MSSRKYTDNELESIDSSDEKSGGTDIKKTFFNTFPRILIFALIAGVAFYLIFKGIGVGSGEFYISDKEINSSSDAVPIKEIKSGSRIYFMVSKKFTDLNASKIVIKIETQSGSDYKTYKNITYEISDEFNKISAYIPEQYFKSRGKFRISALIDNNTVTSYEFNVN